jgi:hypothetical protein
VSTKADFEALMAATTEGDLNSAWGFGGYCDDSGVTAATWDGHYWSSTEDSGGVWYLYCGSGALFVKYNNKLYGFQVRCVK